MDALSNLLQTTAAAASAILMGVCGVCLCVRLTRVMRGEESASGLENETVRALPDGRAMALAAAASLAGLFGLTLGAICLVVHLAGLESFGISYLAPFSGIGGARALLRPRLVREPLRDPLLRPLDRRNQGEKR